MTLSSSFDNQGFLVVDGTKGIAPDVILLAARRNAKVVFTAQAECAAAADQILATARAAGLSDRVSSIITNLADEEAVEQLFDTALERLPGLNVLIHNLEPTAVLEHKPLVEISLAEWNRVLSTEVGAPFKLAQRAVEEYLFGQAGGRIVYIAYAGSGKIISPASYAAARTGLRALVRSITKEFGRREVACNAVVVHQDHGRATSDELIESVLFLASTKSTYVNGEFLDIGSRNVTR